jgi:hypothetical protein
MASTSAPPTRTTKTDGPWVSPLVEVEQAVQARAKEVSLDMSAADGRARLRGLVDEEVARWSEDYKRGLRSFDISDPALVAERAYRNIAGYGPLEPLLADDDVWEIMINAPCAIFCESRIIMPRTVAVTPAPGQAGAQTHAARPFLSRRRPCWPVPPQMPWSVGSARAYARHSAWTRQDRQTALAGSWSSPGSGNQSNSGCSLQAASACHAGRPRRRSEIPAVSAGRRELVA